MSTRSVIAYPTSDLWSGVYCHFDGYPTWRGPEIWTALHAHCHGDTRAFRQRYILDHPGGWSSFGDVCYCHDTDSPMDDGRYDDTDEAHNAARTLEWVYIVGTHALTVYTSVRRGGVVPVVYRDGTPYSTESRYGWARVTSVALSVTAPDWAWIEQLGHDAKDAAYRRYNLGKETD